MDTQIVFVVVILLLVVILLYCSTPAATASVSALNSGQQKLHIKMTLREENKDLKNVGEQFAKTVEEFIEQIPTIIDTSLSGEDVAITFRLPNASVQKLYKVLYAGQEPFLEALKKRGVNANYLKPMVLV